MDISADRLEFTPPATRGLPRALTLAVLAHLLLAAGLTWGVRWKTTAENAVAEAELWSRMPQLQAPKAVEAPTPLPPPPPTPRVAPEPPRPAVNNADIVRERERKLQAEKEKQLQEDRREELQRREALKKKEEAQKLAADKKRVESERQAKERAQEKELQARREQERKEQQEARKAEELRATQLQRLAGLAGSTGAPSATGTALKSSGISAGYAGKLAAAVRPQINTPGALTGSPEVVFEIRTQPDGKIMGHRLKRSSGVRAWDEAVDRAIESTGTLPLDTDKSIPPVFDMAFRP